MSWFPLHTHSHFSLLDGLSKPEQIADRIKELGLEGCALTDHGSIAGCPAFLKAMTKKGLKAILGSEFYICQQDAMVRDRTNGGLSHLCVLAKNQRGWKNLIQASSSSYRPEFSYRKPRLNLERLAAFGKGEFIVFSGHMGSDLANVCFLEPKLAYDAKSYEEAKSLVRKDWKEAVLAEMSRYMRIFGKENFWVEIQLIDQANLPAALVVARILRFCAKELGLPRVATADSHYCRKDDANDQRVLLCSSLETTMKEVQRKLDAAEEVGLGAFFRSNNYHIPSLEEMKDIHEQEELDGAVEIAKRCETYSVGGKPMLPQFDCPDGLTPDQYLMKLCERGWAKKVAGKVSAKRLPEYHARLYDKEYPVITQAGLSSYFLIKQDIISYATEVLKSKTGKGRGSAGGSFLAYLTGITRVDPILNDLLFERFYNAGRNSPGRVALPDIDSDFPIAIREKVIEYIRQKYGYDKVCQMATFSRMQGRGALKDVLRAWEECSYEEMNKITEFIPDEHEIADELQEMMEETGEASIIQWALENNPESLKQWAFFKDDGELDGPMGPRFAQAIRLEGTKRNMSKHASGVIISSEPLADIVPMVWDKSSEQLMVGVDMRDAEELGLVKFDILGLRTLDCIMGAESVIRTGKL
jgi:DNA polymerase-3 subunit alpha